MVLGNPPYNATQADENDNNKNRKYPVIDQRVRETYVADSNATLRSKSYDPYWRFIRWATDRLDDRADIVCFVTNNGFLSGKAADGFRKHLRKDFSAIYHFDMRGNARTTGTRRRAEGGNVFNDQIRAGVGVSVLVRRLRADQRPIMYHAVGDAWRAEAKIEHLKSFPTVSAVPWRQLVPDARNHWVPAQNSGEFDALMLLASKEGKAAKGKDPASVFKTYSMGVSTNRDQVVYDFNKDAVSRRVEEFCDKYNAELDRFRRKGAKASDVDSFVDYKKVKWSRNLKRHLTNFHTIAFDADALRECVVRPFTKQWVYFAPIAIDELGLNRRFFPTPTTDNQVICCTNHPQIDFLVQITGIVADAAVGGRGGQCLPFYVYDEDGTNRRENITDWALEQFRDHYKDKKIDKWAIFHYVYGLLHHPGYREKFADNLKRELPRIPFAPDFRAFADAGAKLAKLHLDYEKLEPWALEFQETPGEPLSYRVEDKMRLSKDKTRLVVNKSLALAGIPPEALEYQLGNRSALEWVIDQYQVCTDKRSGITSDPNRADDEQYIVRLVGQVVRVSVEMMKTVQGLPLTFSDANRATSGTTTNGN